jgi:hypothetical protein
MDNIALLKITLSGIFMSVDMVTESPTLMPQLSRVMQYRIENSDQYTYTFIQDSNFKEIPLLA